MSDLSRRAIVAGLPVVALPVVAVAAPAPSNLSRLLDMERELARIMAAIDAAYPQNVAAFRTMKRMRGKAQPPRQKRFTAHGGYRHNYAKHRWTLRLDRLRIDAGLAASEGQIRDLRQDRDDLTASSWQIPATDLASLQAKARMAEHSNQVLGSLRADVLAMVSL